MIRPLQYHHLMAIGLAFFAFFMSALVSRTVFERLPHLEDEMAYLFQAKIFERGQLVVDTPNPRRAYWQPFVIDYEPTGKRFGKYTPGWPAVLAVGINLGQGWVVNAFMAALTVALTYRLGREIFNPDVGVVGAGLTAFSPMALLLNGTLMGHTEALFFTTLFMYAYWRTSHPQRLSLNHTGEQWRKLYWGALAGFALGMVVISRPLTGVAVVIPFVVWSSLRLLKVLVRRGGTDANPIGEFMTMMYPLLTLGVTALLVSSTIPIFNYAATGNPRQNLYLLQWEYDQIGFGKCCGRNGHRLDKGLHATRWDLTLMAADLFGWELGSVSPTVQQHLVQKSDDFPNTGVSWIMLLFAVWIAFKGRWILIPLWMGSGIWLFTQTFQIPNYLIQSPFLRSIWNFLKLSQDPLNTPEFAWLWVGLAFLWLLIPAAVIFWFGDNPEWYNQTNLKRKTISKLRDDVAWSWLLCAVVLCLIVAHVTYWIGSQLYSTRYYFEALPALAILSALPIVWLIKASNRWLWLLMSVPVLVMSSFAFVQYVRGQSMDVQNLFVVFCAIVFLSAMGLAVWLTKRTHWTAIRRWPVHLLLAITLMYSLYAYSMPRITALYRFNFIGGDVIAEVKQRAQGDKPVLVLVTGDREDNDVRWRATASLMAVTSPYLDSPIVVAWDFAPGDATQNVREKILARFPDRQVIEMSAQVNEAWFVD